jgi:large subunit ribosomal protein L7/L12
MPSTIEQVVELISGMTALELSELKTTLEDKFGVTAASPMMGMAMMPAAAAEEVEEKTSFDVILTEVGSEKLQVIKTVRELTSLGLKEAKELVDGVPQPVKEGATKDEAEKIKTALEAVHAKVEVK